MERWRRWESGGLGREQANAIRFSSWRGSCISLGSSVLDSDRVEWNGNINRGEADE